MNVRRHPPVQAMTKYFRLLQTRDIRQEIGATHRQVLKAFNLDDPVALGDSFPKLSLECERTQPMPDYFRSGPNAIVSDRFRKVCEGFRVPAEFLAINVVFPAGLSAPGNPFWFLHPLELLDCIDYDRSEYETFSERPDSVFRQVTKLEFREEAIANRDFFKPKRFPFLFVSDGLRRGLLQADCLVQFAPLEKVKL